MIMAGYTDHVPVLDKLQQLGIVLDKELILLANGQCAKSTNQRLSEFLDLALDVGFHSQAIFWT
jgi:hypothetical protein